MKYKKNGFKKSLQSFVSLIALLVIGWMLFFGRSKIFGIISPYLSKIPKNESVLVGYTDNILGKAVEAAKGGRMKIVVEKGSEFFENSQFAEPGREIREDVKRRINEVAESLKQLPAKELKIIKMEIYKQWFSDIATESGNQ